MVRERGDTVNAGAIGVWFAANVADGDYLTTKDTKVTKLPDVLLSTIILDTDGVRFTKY
jgi:hypothetical protein